MRQMNFGEGVALMFHRVLKRSQISPVRDLRGLEVCQTVYLELIAYLKNKGYKFITPRQYVEHLQHSDQIKKFVMITFDDGYEDNAKFVANVMEDQSLPWALYITTGFCDRTLGCWWYGLGEAVQKQKTLDARMIGLHVYQLSTGSQNALDDAYRTIRNHIHQMWATTEGQSLVQNWFQELHIDLLAISNRLAMNWSDVNRLNQGVCEIGAHSINHLNLKNCKMENLRNEVSGSKTMLESKIFKPVTSFAYPYGDPGACGPREFNTCKELGFLSAFTTVNKWLPHPGQLNLFQMPRMNVSGTWESLDDILLRVYGWSTWRETFNKILNAQPTGKKFE